MRIFFNEGLYLMSQQYRTEESLIGNQSDEKIN